jgi:type II secretory pathway pseudopilin PulG
MIAISLSALLLAAAGLTFVAARRKFDAACRMEDDAQATYLDAQDLYAESGKRLTKAYEVCSRLEAKVGGAQIVH